MGSNALNTSNLNAITDKICLARDQMRNGDFLRAKTIFLELAPDFHNDPEIIMDLASCCYVEDQFDQFKSFTEKAFDLFQKLSKEKDSPRYIPTINLLSKLAMGLEELAMFDTALNLYQIPHLHGTAAYESRKRVLDANLARLGLEMGWKKEKLDLLFSQLAAPQLIGDFSDRHVVYAIATYESAYHNLKDAFNRLDQFYSERTSIPVALSRGTYFGVLYAAVKSNNIKKSDLLFIDRLVKTQETTFEKYLIQLTYAIINQDMRSLPSFHEITQLLPSDRLKISKLILSNFSQEHSDIDKYLIEIETTVNSLKKKDRGLCKTILKEKSSIENANSTKHRFQLLSTSSRRLFHFIRMNGARNLTVHEASEEFFGKSDIFSLENRIRVAIHRFNKELKTISGLENCVRIEQGILKIDPTVLELFFCEAKNEAN